MRTATKERTPILQMYDGEWLYLLLADIRDEIAKQPSARAVERIRGHLLTQLRQPTKAAA